VRANSEVRSQTTDAASESSEAADRSLLGISASQSTQRLFAAFNLAELTAANQSEQKYVHLLSNKLSAISVKQMHAERQIFSQIKYASFIGFSSSSAFLYLHPGAMGQRH